MKLPAIKKLVQDYTTVELEQANESLLNGQPLKIEVDGDDEGEQLTHIFAALWVKEYMKKTDKDAATSLRAYTAMVRQSFQ